jgi:hypothetical protein
MLGNVTKAIHWTKILGNTAAGKDISEVDGAAIDARGYDRALFVLELGAVTSGGKLALNIQESANGTDFTDITGAGFAATVATGKSDDTIMIDVPVTKGYLRYQYQRTTENVEFDALQVILYNPKRIPVTQNANVWQEIVIV